MYSLCIPYVLPYVFPMYSLCIPYVFPMFSLCFSYVLPMYSLCIPYVFPMYSLCNCPLFSDLSPRSFFPPGLLVGEITQVMRMRPCFFVPQGQDGLSLVIYKQTCF